MSSADRLLYGPTPQSDPLDRLMLRARGGDLDAALEAAARCRHRLDVVTPLEIASGLLLTEVVDRPALPEELRDRWRAMISEELAWLLKKHSKEAFKKEARTLDSVKLAYLDRQVSGPWLEHWRNLSAETLVPEQELSYIGRPGEVSRRLSLALAAGLSKAAIYRAEALYYDFNLPLPDRTLAQAGGGKLHTVAPGKTQTDCGLDHLGLPIPLLKEWYSRSRLRCGLCAEFQRQERLPIATKPSVVEGRARFTEIALALLHEPVDEPGRWATEQAQRVATIAVSEQFCDRGLIKDDRSSRELIEAALRPSTPAERRDLLDLLSSEW